jgi:hypothetical protein
MSIKVDVDTGNLAALAEQAAERATEIVMDELFAAFQQSFSAEAWAWPRNLPTRKLNGATVREKAASYGRGEGITPPNPRNLIDNKNLRDTGSSRMVGKYEALFTWSAEYANFVHEGGFIWAWGRRPPLKGARSVLIPARPWTRAVLGQENVPGVVTYDVGKRLRDVWMVQFRPR